MKYVAFFRNLNLGRANCPTKAQFEAAFVAAGAISASSFLTNGTMVFSVGPGCRARQLLADASTLLRGSCGLREPAFIRPLGDLAEWAAMAPFASVHAAGVYACCISFLHEGCDLLAEPLPQASSRGDVRVVQCTATEVFSVSLKIGNTPGSPNAFIEKHLDRPATTRNWNTVLRLVQRHAARSPTR